MKIDCEASNGKETAAVDPVLSNELNRMEDEILEQANSNKLDDEASVNIEEKRNLEMIDNTIKYADIPTSIYPNPATDFITVDIDDQASLQNVKITVLDNGQNRIFEGQAKSRSQKIDLRNFKSGIYYLVVRSDKGRTTQQFIVAR